MQKKLTTGLHFETVLPTVALSYFVESFWTLRNTSASDKEVVVLPDGRIDLILSQSATEPFHIMLSGLEARAGSACLKAGTIMVAVSFKLPAVEYVLHRSVASILNYAEVLPADFWGFRAADLEDFSGFKNKAEQQILSLLPTEMDNRKTVLFELLYAAKGELPIEELSRKVYWSSRQIGRYFGAQFGLSPKAYCNILRFRASWAHLAQGKFFPELSFADQSHFIREVKKFSGVSPKELGRNKDDRFIQFSALG